MERRGKIIIALLFSLLLSGLTLAAAQAPAIERHVAGAGGGRLSGGNITVDNTLGQPLAGSRTAAGLDLCAGFWCALPGRGQPPVAGLDGAPRQGPVPLTVRFTDTSAYTPTAWLWTFGDGASSTSQHPSHVYGHAGTYTVTLSVTNEYGSDVATRPGYIIATTHHLYLPLVVRKLATP